MEVNISTKEQRHHQTDTRGKGQKAKHDTRQFTGSTAKKKREPYNTGLGNERKPETVGANPNTSSPSKANSPQTRSSTVSSLAKRHTKVQPTSNHTPAQTGTSPLGLMDKASDV